MLNKKKTEDFIKYSLHYSVPEFQELAKSKDGIFGGVYLIKNNTNKKCFVGASENDICHLVQVQLEGRGKVQVYLDLIHGNNIEIIIKEESDAKKQKRLVKLLQKQLKINTKGYGALRQN